MQQMPIAYQKLWILSIQNQTKKNNQIEHHSISTSYEPTSYSQLICYLLTTI